VLTEDERAPLRGEYRVPKTDAAGLHRDRYRLAESRRHRRSVKAIVTRGLIERDRSGTFGHCREECGKGYAQA
jgi:hypothetical protein